MRGIDSNILLRVLMNDDPVQSPLARDLMQNEEVFIPVSVVLEIYWVLKGRDVPSPAIIEAFQSLLQMPGVVMHEAAALNAALVAHEDGLEFADALHWALSGRCEAFMSFDDKRFVRRAQKLKLIPPCVVPE